jgi:hypothetical protein
MSALDHCREEEISIRVVSGLKRVQVWRYGEFAIHYDMIEEDLWVMTHVPTGLSMRDGGAFKTKGGGRGGDDGSPHAAEQLDGPPR